MAFGEEEDEDDAEKEKDLHFNLYDDENGPFTEEDLLNVISNHNPNLLDLSIIPNPNPNYQSMTILPSIHDHSISVSNQTYQKDDIDQFLNDDFTLSWDIFEEETETESTRLEVSDRIFGANEANFEAGGTSTNPIPITPTLQDGIFICSCCSTLRELIHCNGENFTKLKIYGGIGFFCHGILEIQKLVNTLETRHYTYLLKDMEIEDVKKFLEVYCNEKMGTGYTMIQDYFAPFYRTMGVFTNFPDHQPPPPLMFKPPIFDNSMSQIVPFQAIPPLLPSNETRGSSDKGKTTKTPLAAQRERTGKMTLKDIGMHFHLPIEEAAKRMNLCATAVKKICRRGGLTRWPHRRIKSIEKKIASWRSVLRTSKEAMVRANAEREIDKLQKEIQDICTEALKSFK